MQGQDRTHYIRDLDYGIFEGVKFRPLYNQVLIKQRPHEQTSGSLVIPDVADKKQHVDIGTVLDVGKGRRLKDGSIRPLAIKAGDTVMYHAFGGEDHMFDGEMLHITPEEHVIAVVEE
jgi:chaperonin GroES